MGHFGQQAEYQTRRAYLSDDFGYDLAVKWFGQEEVDKLPVAKKGKNAGKPQGVVSWCKVVAGGYHPTRYSSSGHIEKRKGQVIGKCLYSTKWRWDIKAKRGIPYNNLEKNIGDLWELWDDTVSYQSKELGYHK